MILQGYGKLEFMFAVMEDVVSLLVVNLTVIAAWVFRLSDDSESPYHVNTVLRERSRPPGITTAFGLTTFGVEVNLDTEHVSDREDGKSTVVSVLDGVKGSNDSVHKLPPTL
ncbi:hypothetical protein MPER_07718 [Moniliophthora perniciosa FA553]|nr:hypothetical protein MPER_07718 [Moniliophthora perniciosa FA553]